MSTFRDPGPKKHASPASPLTFAALAFLLVAAVFLLTGNAGTGVALLAIGAALLAIGQDRSRSRSCRR